MALPEGLKGRQLIRDLFSFGSVTALASAFTFILGIFTRRMVGPELFGVWLTVSLVFTYGPLIQLGILNAMNREVPYYLAKGDVAKTNKLKNAAFSFLFGLPLLSCLGLLIFGLVSFYCYQWEEAYSLGIAFSSLILFLMLITTFVEMVYKSEQDFKGLSGLTAVKSFTNALLTLMFTAIWGYLGLFAGMGLGLLMELLVGRKKLREMSFDFDLAEFKNMARIGLPILFVGTVWGFMTGIDRIIIAAFLKPVDLGYYGVALMAYNAIMMFPLVLAQVMYPKFPQRLGQTGDYLTLGSLIIDINKAVAPVMALVVGLVFVALPPFIKYALPEYFPGTGAAQILCAGVYPLTLVGMAGSLFITLDKQKFYLLCVAVTALLITTFSLIFLQAGAGIAGVAWANALGYSVYAVLMNWGALRTIGLPGGLYACKLFLPVLFILIPVMAIQWWIKSGTGVLVYSLGWMLLCSPFLLKSLFKAKGC